MMYLYNGADSRTKALLCRQKPELFSILVCHWFEIWTTEEIKILEKGIHKTEEIFLKNSMAKLTLEVNLVI